ncbi:MAG: hypothetical protein UX02_C0001G0043 [Candidatus Moranbacteria bacterium GW2011_GWC1_45_18]|nr:MAG: hypothetical protein UT79_C0002G0354 [Candidatus Moranbacteria bacterium GW2011_GWC2_40_12]KKT34194.1 MAG: hypothetical protein UW19_C0001G0089 [Candidatus Moranbacteria bacterium GW2011_GWF2_44_10]KKU00595.1 MAG: hypothetical protein UX02_C0001G0043 [Candidatus Moranbacteria bacterium GW2011_GWC1_45_18]
MGYNFFDLLTKITPTFTIRHRMRFFGMQSIEKYKIVGSRNKEVEELITICRYWAEQILKRNPDDEEAKAFRNFPNKSFSDWIKSREE